MHIVPNILTVLRCLAVIVVAVLLVPPLGPQLWPAFVIFVLAAVTDWFDGYIARTFQVTSDFGRMLDSIADKLLVAVTLLTLVAAGLIPGWHAIAAAVILYREIAISGLREHLGPKGIVIPPSMAGKLKTTVQLVAIAALIAAPLTPLPRIALWSGLALLWIAAALTIISGVQYAWGARTAFGGRPAAPMPADARAASPTMPEARKETP
ncbi:CDP-diacylglycerol--glycerol-3-phosphate 3-phosphatidyltransferase [Acuticoccus mangrovi]|uniref:CDP-diacylglycerol--glycerol-3-phosphate 3-phosphatidyltransferase n=1 Tax=Acuticoccus mangrovi TaxID=2796142 RepID=A0A934IRQ4_9HYPH|nr:CDP-diacylglycerol--glycerol-3-phosphate 3-phosphatidyltransferase [Acuticoccus mangrovi]MBJ3776835.1 CDP-diacylglycerol--glycerol-3-phosphate 3-phosphatidyltransferase [Acuticoccus mangrovi]